MHLRGYDLNRTTGTDRYEESGLKHVTLVNVPLYKCPDCGETEIEIPRMEALPCLLGLLLLRTEDWTKEKPSVALS